MKKAGLIGFIGIVLAGIVVLVVFKMGEVEHSELVRLTRKEINEHKIELGKHLFFDPRLSKDKSISCASCHFPEKAFTDGLPFSKGINGHFSKRNAPSLFNIAQAPYFMMDGGVPSLTAQAIVPIQDSNEMGAHFKEILLRLKNDQFYKEEARLIFNRSIDPYVITQSLAAYERTLISSNSRFDQYRKGNKQVLSEDEIAGFVLFSEKLNCTECHSGKNLTNYSFQSNGTTITDLGRYLISGKEEDKYHLKVPSLRNVTLTSPYMHNGSLKTLDEVIDLYSRGGGKGQNKSKHLKSFQISDEERKQLKLFFGTLIDIQ